MTLHAELANHFAEASDSSDFATGLSLLEHQGLISVTGGDADKFLQGQITCDLRELDQAHSSLGARCNPKGRMQSSFRIWRTADGMLLSLARELVAPQLADLGRYAALYRQCQLADQSDDWAGFGLWGEQAEQALTTAGFQPPAEDNGVSRKGDSVALRLPGAAYAIWAPIAEANALLQTLADHASLVSANQWQLRQIQSGIGQVTGPTLETFIPQMLNLQHLGGVSFRKGCYTGQEIVARMQYLGKLKRRMYRLLMAGDAPPKPGTEVFDRDSGKAVGDVVIAARGHKAVELLAVLQKDAAQLATLSLGATDGPLLTLSELPYEQTLAAAEAE
ncbi:YgfZ/GcvT domain-containing protein [Pseudomonas abyssi]|uniref:CAF17-like 4Fe-4S cluster assembly/insertion protein YgfZ n=1 Tax=Pseudomonas abyssi TaxID=170540 RepID=UPI003C7E1546